MKTELVRRLLLWMESCLNTQGNFSVADLEEFFAKSFVIKTNNKRVEATPSTYRDYLYGFKKSLSSVKYDVEDLIESPNAVVAFFVIHLNFTDKQAQNLRTISIFKFNPQGRISEWSEVFVDADEQNLSYELK